MEEIKRWLGHYQARPLGISRWYSIMIPLFYQDGEVQVLFEHRAEGISQAGDASFPGGQVEKGESFEEAAIRETMEELGLPRERIEIYGETDFIVQKDRVIDCFAGRLHIDSPAELSGNPEEVAHFFAVPLSYFYQNEPQTYTLKGEYTNLEGFPYEKVPGGKAYPLAQNGLSEDLLFYNISGEYLWGLTARVIQGFVQVLKEGNIEP